MEEEEEAVVLIFLSHQEVLHAGVFEVLPVEVCGKRLLAVVVCGALGLNGCLLQLKN